MHLSKKIIRTTRTIGEHASLFKSLAELHDFCKFRSTKKKKNISYISYESPAFWQLVIRLELLASRQRFAVFFNNKIMILLCHLRWNHYRFNFHFVHHDALYFIFVRKKTPGRIISAVLIRKWCKLRYGYGLS